MNSRTMSTSKLAARPGLGTAIRAEAHKLRRSLVGIIASSALIVGTLALLTGITAGVASGNEELIAQAGPAANLNWDGLLLGAGQITAAGGLIGFGVVLAWLIAREFTDGTIAGLFALPISRGRIAGAKLVVYAIWAVIISTALTLGILSLGLAFSYGLPTGEVWQGLFRQWALTIFTAAITTPVAWLAAQSRSILAAVGGAICLAIFSQVGGLAGIGGWFPFTAPALWAMSNGSAVNAAQLSLSLAVGVAGAVFTWRTWQNLELDR